MFCSLLIANGGQIACRVIRTIAVYSDPDAHLPPVAAE